MWIRLIIVRRLGNFVDNGMSFLKSLFQDGGINSTDPVKRIAAIETVTAKGGADAATRIGQSIVVLSAFVVASMRTKCSTF